MMVETGNGAGDAGVMPLQFAEVIEPGILLDRRVVSGAMGLFCALLSGCLGGFVYPKVAYSPAVRLDPSCPEVHAFRIDASNAYNDYGSPLNARATLRYSFRTLPLPPSGVLPPQIKASLEANWGVLLLLPTVWTNHLYHDLRVRLYRPGYDLVEIDSWGAVENVVWQPEPDLAAQEMVIDSLLAPWHFGYEGTPLRRPESLDHIVPGSDSENHRQALLFVASEYERLASMPAGGDAAQRTQPRLAAKATKLRELANK